MYGNNTFDANAAFSGGCFIQATQTADTFFTPAKNCEIQGLLPLTVKQISEASQPSNVKLVGFLFQKAERGSYISFVLNDGTGRINCIRWANDAVHTKEMELLSDGMYVKVHGHFFQGRKEVVVYAVRRVTDYDEIAYHFKDCMFVHLYNTTRTRKMNDAPQVTGQMSNAAVRTSSGYQPTLSDYFSAQCSMDVSQDVYQLILNYLQQPIFINHLYGAHRADIAKQLNLPEHKILEAIEYLESEGLVYSTDEFHYRYAPY